MSRLAVTVSTAAWRRSPVRPRSSTHSCWRYSRATRVDSVLFRGRKPQSPPRSRKQCAGRCCRCLSPRLCEVERLVPTGFFFGWWKLASARHWRQKNQPHWGHPSRGFLTCAHVRVLQDRMRSFEEVVQTSVDNQARDTVELRESLARIETKLGVAGGGKR